MFSTEVLSALSLVVFLLIALTVCYYLQLLTVSGSSIKEIFLLILKNWGIPKRESAEDIDAVNNAPFEMLPGMLLTGYTGKAKKLLLERLKRGF